MLQYAKMWAMAATGLAKDALHIHVALALFFGSALVFRWRLSSWRPWAIVAAAAMLGEAWDLRDTIAAGRPVRPWANWHDIWNTLLWPSAILLLARARWLR